MAMKTNGGVIQIVGLSGFVKVDPPERAPAITTLRQEFGLGGGRGAGAGRGAAPEPPATAKCPIETPGSTTAANAQPGGGRGGRGQAGLESLSADRRAEYDRRMAEIRRVAKMAREVLGLFRDLARRATATPTAIPAPTPEAREG